MLNLRATYLNEEWDSFWAYHVEQEDERLYRNGTDRVVTSCGIGVYTR
jgi:hypothetical protein